MNNQAYDCKCVWKSREGNKCNRSIMNGDVNYCKMHEVYKNLDPNKIDEYKKCKNCKNIYDDNNNDKKLYCISCEPRICVWRFKDDKPCTCIRVNDKVSYCKIHKKYDKLNPDRIDEYKKCKTCKDYFEGELLTCEKCLKTGDENRKKKKKFIEDNKDKYICIFVNDENKRCSNKKNNKLKHKDYCGHHQTIAQNMIDYDFDKLCINRKRGCRNYPTNNITCESCLEKTRITDNENFKAKKIIACRMNNNLINITPDMFACSYCNCIVSKELYINEKCFKCYSIMRYNGENCIRKETPEEKKYRDLRYRCENNNFELTLTLENTTRLYNSPCVFCNRKEHITIDRISSLKGYTLDNTQSSCYTCNIMKGSLFNTNEEFITAIKHILSIRGLIKDNVKEHAQKLFNVKETHVNKYNCFIEEANNRGINCNINKTQYIQLVNNKCYYCNFHKDGAKGVDRKNSNICYNIDNLVSCCKTCNFMKNMLSEKQFYNNLLYIYKNCCNKNYDISKIKYTILDTNYHYIMNKDESEYIQMKYNGSTNNISLDDMTLELVENEDDKNNWNYFIIKHKLYHTNIINKSTTTRNYFIKYMNKIIGMISIDDDNFVNRNRDKYLGWSMHNKELLMKYFVKIKFIHNFTDNKELDIIFPLLIKSNYNSVILWVSIYENVELYKNNKNYTIFKGNNLNNEKYNKNKHYEDVESAAIIMMDTTLINTNNNEKYNITQIKNYKFDIIVNGSYYSNQILKINNYMLKDINKDNSLIIKRNENMNKLYNKLLLESKNAINTVINKIGN